MFTSAQKEHGNGDRPTDRPTIHPTDGHSEENYTSNKTYMRSICNREEVVHKVTPYSVIAVVLFAAATLLLYSFNSEF